MMKKKLSESEEDDFICGAYVDTENFLDTLERFGFKNPAKCSSCDDYGCSSALGDYIQRMLNRFEE